jgi:hypothetical protein
LFDGVKEVMTRYQPDCASVEIVFVNVNPQSTCCWAWPSPMPTLPKPWPVWRRLTARLAPVVANTRLDAVAEQIILSSKMYVCFVT